MSKTQPPGPAELEISVFGPGYGESVLVHVGHGAWFVIDSCIDPRTKRSAPLDYLESIGAEPGSAIRLVVASHWHADHVRGLHQIYSAATSAKFSCAESLTRQEFLTLAKIYSMEPGKIPLGPEELHRCLTTVRERTTQSGTLQHRWAGPDRILWQTASHDPVKVRLITLSPSDEMHSRTIEMMLNYIKVLKRGFAEPGLLASCPNDVAVAILLEINGRQILLGSDLEQESNAKVGWSAVMAGEAVRDSKCCVFKVAHHGSGSGHSEAVWDQLMEPQPLAFITPFRHGSHRIPTDKDRARILARTGDAYISADPNVTSKAPKKSAKVQAIVGNTIKNRRLANGPMGHIRWRAPIDNLADRGLVELFDGALPLSAVAGARAA
jgi:hypothetical protein